jgi:hypothetical protein
MDSALALLVRNCSGPLETLSLFAGVKPIGAQQTSYPRFLEALKDNITIQHVHLRDQGFIYDDEEDEEYFILPWDEDFRAAIDIITRLNRSGRGYLKQHAADQRTGLPVLEKVNDDLSCIFFHLRENPVLCKRQNPPSGVGSPEAGDAASATRKRKPNAYDVCPKTKVLIY